jgi:hypothetical protein
MVFDYALIGRTLLCFVGFRVYIGFTVDQGYIPVGFIITGLGFSAIMPEGYRLALHIEGIKTNDGVSVISATTNIGFMVDPIFPEFLAELRMLHFSFLTFRQFRSLRFRHIGFESFHTQKTID